MSLYQTILDDITTAMKAKDADKLRVLRSLKAALLEKEISERKGGEATLSEEQVVQVLMKASKQRKDSISQFEAAGRSDLADNEKLELSIIESYLPKMMNEDEIASVVKEIIAQTGASGMAEIGKVMGPVMGRLKGKADGGLVNKVVKSLLG